MAEEIQEVQAGTAVEILCTVVDEDGVVVDVSSATSLSICLRDPSGVVSVKTALLFTDGLDGKMYYKTLITDLIVTGTWTAQGKVILPSGEYPTKRTTFKVVKNICP